MNTVFVEPTRDPEIAPEERNDWALLQSFAAHANQDAFAAVVQRYAGLVHSAAMRQTRRPDLAQEVAQIVFILLARKAHRFSRTVILSGWLIRATRFASANLMKTERRRQHREQEAAEELFATHDAVNAWEQLAPHLDEALTHLSDADRNTITLRYFEGKSLREVGAALAINEEAAKKRVVRAVERLRTWFQRRSITVSAAALCALLPAHAVQAASAAFAKAVIAASLNSSALPAATMCALKGTTWALKSHSLKALLKWLVLVSLLVSAGLAFLVWPAASSVSNSPQETLRGQTRALQNGDGKGFVQLLDLETAEERRLGDTLERVVRSQHRLRSALTNRFGANVDLSRFGFPLDEVNQADLLRATVVVNGSTAILTWSRGSSLQFRKVGRSWRSEFFRPPNRTLNQLIIDYSHIIDALDATAAEVERGTHDSVNVARSSYRQHRR